MKKISAFTITWIALGAFSYASPISQQWVKSYGGDSGGTLGVIKQTVDGGYIGAGTNRSSTAILVRKLDYNGDISWEKTYSYGDWINEAYTMQQTSDGGYIVGGHTSARDTYDKAWLIKLDSNGDITWQKTYNEVWRFSSIQQTTDGGYIAGGDYIKEVAPGMYDNDLLLLKLDSMGNISWAKSYDLSLQEYVPYIQQTPDLGYIVIGHIRLGLVEHDILLLKLDSSGGVSWQKRYGGGRLYGGFPIHLTTDGGYMICGDSRASGAGDYDFWVLKLDQNGNTLWQKTYGGHGDDYIRSLQQTPDGGYTVVGNTRSFGLGESDILVVRLDDTGSIIWQKTYGGSDSDSGVYYGKTMDGGSIVVGYSNSLSAGHLTIFKLDSNGDIPDCDVIGISNLEVFDTDITGEDTNVTIESPPISVTATNIIPQNTLAEISVVCYYEDPDDIDGDGVENNPDGAIASSVYGGSFLAYEDNCPEAPNGPFLGTCTKGNVGSTCIANEACGVGGICSMNQEDTYPPQGNEIGDSCECESDFDCDGDVDAGDVVAILGTSVDSS